MKNTNIFKILSIGLLIYPLASSAMEPENHGAQKILLSIANQSERAIDASILTQNALSQDNALIIQPYEDSDSVIFKNDNACITTQQGFFTLAPDDLYQPMSWVLSHHKTGHEEQTIVVQEIPYHRSNNIVVIVNPDDFVSLAQAEASYAEEKMNAIEQNEMQTTKVPHASIDQFNLNGSLGHFNCGYGYATRMVYDYEAVIVFDQEPSNLFINNFIEYLLQGHISSTTQITVNNEQIHLRDNIELSRELLQEIIDLANKHFKKDTTVEVDEIKKAVTKPAAYIHEFYPYGRQRSQTKLMSSRFSHNYLKQLYHVQIRFDQPVTRAILDKLSRYLARYIQAVSSSRCLMGNVIEMDVFESREVVQRIIDQANAVLHDGNF